MLRIRNKLAILAAQNSQTLSPKYTLQRLSKVHFQRPTRALSSSRVKLSSSKPKETYEEAMKRQWREYREWRQHFKWKQEHINEFFHDYALWSVLALVAYYHMGKRQERNDYESSSYVTIDNLVTEILKVDPKNPVAAKYSNVPLDQDQNTASKDIEQTQNGDHSDTSNTQPQGPRTPKNNPKDVFF